MEMITIEVSKGKFKSAKEARRNNEIPMVCYNKAMEPEHFTTDYQNFRRAFLKAGKSSIISLQLDGKNIHDVLVHEVQYEPISDDIRHVDLMPIIKGQSISTEIPIVFVGESAAVRELGGIFMSNKEKLNIQCLPKDLIHEIEVDISSLEDFHNTLSVADIKVPKTITILDAPEISIAGVSQPRDEKEEEVVEAATEAPAEGDTPAEDKKEA